VEQNIKRIVMENRRDFFKALGLFATGVITTKVASYIPKKEEELQVAESVAVKDKDGNEYNMVVVPKKKEEPVAMPKSSSLDFGERFKITSSGNAIIGHHVPETMLVISQNKKLRKLNA
jgi:hypothetical protein